MFERLNDPSFGNQQLKDAWFAGLRTELAENVDMKRTFTLKTKAKPDELSTFMVIFPMRRFVPGGYVYPSTAFWISADGLEPLVRCRLPESSKDISLEVVMLNVEVFCEDDLRAAMKDIMAIINQFVKNDWEGDTLTNKIPTTPEKDRLVTLIAKSVVPAKAEFTLGVHAPFVTEVLAPHFCDLSMEKGEVLKRLKVLERGAMGGRREYIAKNDLVRQLIAYGLTFRITPADEIQFMIYKRNKKNGEKQMVSVFSLAIGGHAEVIPDYADYMAYDDANVTDARDTAVAHTNIMDLYSTTDRSFHREGPEEVTYYQGDVDVTAGVMASATPIGFVCDSSDTQGFVGNSHFGIVYLTEAPGNATFEMNEINNDSVGWATAEQLVEILFLRARRKEQEKLVFPVGDIICEASVEATVLDGLTNPEEMIVDEQFLENDFEPWSQYIIHNLRPLVERIRNRQPADRQVAV